MDCYLVEEASGETKTLFFETVNGETTMYVYDGDYAVEVWSLEEQYELATEYDFRVLSGGVTVTPEQKKAVIATMEIRDHDTFRRK